MQFEPATVTVRSGERVRFVNRDLFAHTATQSGHAFDSGSIAPGGSWVWVAGAAGRWPYVCAFHPTMKGELIVR
jgi:plastocyanin